MATRIRKIAKNPGSVVGPEMIDGVNHESRKLVGADGLLRRRVCQSLRPFPAPTFPIHPNTSDDFVELRRVVWANPVDLLEYWIRRDRRSPLAMEPIWKAERGPGFAPMA